MRSRGSPFVRGAPNRAASTPRARSPSERRLRCTLEQLVEAPDAIAEDLRHDLVRVEGVALREECDVERDLTGRDLSDRDRLADHRVVRVVALDRADQSAAIVGDDHDAVFPEVLEASLFEPVAEVRAGKAIGKTRVAEDPDAELVRGALVEGVRERDELARPRAD